MGSDTPRLMLVGPSSGSGKTTVSCALLLALKRLGHNPAAFKCGPDYIDPMFHTEVLGIDSCNLDTVMCGEAVVRYLLARNAVGHGIALIEGVMGVYDGQGSGEYGSSNHLALLTDTPAILVLPTRGQGLTLVAQLSGYLNFMPNTIKGVIFNQTTAKMYPFYRDMVEKHLGITAYGHLPPLPQAAFDSRHLGLVLPEETNNLHAKLKTLADACMESVDLEGLLRLGASAGELACMDLCAPKMADLSLAVARDKAFCFYYRDNLEYLQELGASLSFFSPLADAHLPPGVSGLILGGGYPEEYAATLAQNSAMRESVRQAVEGSLPVLAECGGFMYLCRTLRDRHGISHHMAGLVDTDTAMTSRLGPFGYVTLTAGKDTFLCPKGTVFTGHEFHYSHSADCGNAFTARKADGRSWPGIHASGPDDRTKIFAGYPHFHFRGNPGLASAFVAACQNYAKGRE